MCASYAVQKASLEVLKDTMENDPHEICQSYSGYAYSKGLKVKAMSSSTFAAPNAFTDDFFTEYCTPVTFVSDNGKQFIAEKFLAEQR